MSVIVMYTHEVTLSNKGQAADGVFLESLSHGIRDHFFLGSYSPL